jgi:hypothetical protein
VASNRVVEVFSAFSPSIEVYSIVESFLELSGFERQEGGFAVRTVRELRGVSCLDMQEVVPDKQQIMSSRSFG